MTVVDAPEAPPTVTFVVPVPSSAGKSWLRLLSSLALQTSACWDAVFVHALPPNEVPPADGRVRHVGAGSGALLADALTLGIAEAGGDYIAFLNPKSHLEPWATALLLESASAGADVVYGDERIGGATFYKPVFSPERLRCQPYLGDTTIFRMSLVKESGGIRADVPGAELYDLALRATRSAREVAHVPHVVSARKATSITNLWGVSAEVQESSIARVLNDHLLATGGGSVVAVGADGVHRTQREVKGEPLVSIVIPTRGGRAVVHGSDRCLVVEAVRSVLELSTYKNIEFVVVLDEEAPEEVATQLQELAGDALRLVPWDKPFSFSGKVNLGVLHAVGEYVLLLNDDIEVITPSWIEPMLALAQLPNAGIVGPMLYFEDDTIQHAGHAYIRLDVTHIGMFSPRGSAGPWGAFRVEREVIGVTAACAVVRKDLFISVGGLSPLLPGNFNDVDICMKLATAGYQAYWTPRAELYHFESKSRDPRVGKSEERTAWGRWEHLFWESPWWPTDPHEVFGLDRHHRLH